MNQVLYKPLAVHSDRETCYGSGIAVRTVHGVYSWAWDQFSGDCSLTWRRIGKEETAVGGWCAVLGSPATPGGMARCHELQHTLTAEACPFRRHPPASRSGDFPSQNSGFEGIVIC